MSAGSTSEKSAVEDLYKAFGVLADAKDKAGEHEAEFRSFLAATKGSAGEKRLASQFICRFFKFFPKAQDDAIHALFELCEDPDASIRKQAIKDIPALCRGCPDKVSRFADALSMLLGVDDAQEVSSIQAALYNLFSINMKGAMEGIFTRLLQTGEDEDGSDEVMGLIRERLLKFLVSKVKQYGDMDKDVEDYIMQQSKKLLEDVTKDEFIAVMELLRSLKTMTTVQSRQQLVEMVVDQAALDEPFEVNWPVPVSKTFRAMEGIFTRLLQTGEDEDGSDEVMGLIRERLLKFLVSKVKQYGDMDKDVEDYIMQQSKKLLEDVTKDEFIAVMELLRSLKTMTTVQSRQQLVEMVVDQAALDEPFEASDPDCVDRLLHCIKSATPMFSKNVHSKQFVAYMCDHVLPVLKDVVSPDEETNIQLEVLKTFAEISEFAGDLDKLNTRVDIIFSALLEHMPLPPSEGSVEAASTEDPKLNFSQVECLMFAFHQIGRKLPEFLVDDKNAERLKDFRVRLQYMALSSQICTKRLKEALQGKSGELLRTDENKKRVVALKLFTNITVLVKDLMHNPPAYKVAVTLSWKPTREPKVTESGENTVTSPTGAKRSITPITYDNSDGKKGNNPKQARTLYQPPSGKFSDKAGSYTNFNSNGNNSYGGYNNRGYRGNWRGRGGFRGRGRRGARGGGLDTGFYQNKLS
ncbi:Apoptosis inhibitor 5 [Plakobranchus ocellatus]|uniref:Apoptosis inhibitor 5 n=1 Tax=Plakobranchus ocellatus TaxID=259542 RepID=A0AAV4E230_9GAST|nr:Apoptosis inhibitor 5 [Plakobranchus ocellatus]